MKRGIIALFVILFLVVVLIISGSGCFPEPGKYHEQEQIDMIVENIMQSINDNNYNSFINYTSEEFDKSFNEDGFEYMYNFSVGQNGTYISKESNGISKNIFNGVTLIVYKYICSFEKGELLIDFSFKPESYELEGLHFTFQNKTS